MKNLKWLTINANPMSGTIPTELGLCEDLIMVRLHQTNIAGTMPMSICKLRDSTLFSNTNGILYADCRPNNRTGEPFVICDCCSDCCDHTSQVCVADDWTVKFACFVINHFSYLVIIMMEFSEEFCKWMRQMSREWFRPTSASYHYKVTIKL